MWYGVRLGRCGMEWVWEDVVPVVSSALGDDQVHALSHLPST